MKQVIVTLIFTVVGLHVVGAQQEGQEPRRDEGAIRLAATRHPALPSDRSQYWFVQDPVTSASRNSAALARFVRGVKAIASGNFTAGLPLVNDPELAKTSMADYARYYTGVALAGLSRWSEADAVFSALMLRLPNGYLREAVPLRVAEIAQARQDGARAERVLRDVKLEEISAPEEALLKLATVEESVGHREHALEAYRRLYYDYPLSTLSIDAQNGINRLQGLDAQPDEMVSRNLARAERLFSARRWLDARAAFEGVARSVQGDNNKDLVALRLAECDYRLDRYRAARDGVKPFTSHATFGAEARFFYLSAVKALGDRTSYVTLSRELVADFPESEWSAEALNNLAQFFLTTDDDEGADQVFREILVKFPQHRYAERAAWKAGWTDYRARRFAQAASIFESAAATFPRADTRPAWLYWSARSRDQAGDTSTANMRYRLLVTDYGNSYYGRLGSAILSSRHQPLTLDSHEVVPASIVAVKAPPTDALLRELTGLQLYDDALREVQYAQLVWGDSPQLQATSAWIRHQQGLGLKAQDRFVALRGAINTMRRAYPQFLTASGDDLPKDVLRIIFPLDYWPLIDKYSRQLGLDPYLMAALMAQESTFTAEIRSPANARGLMQLMPSTARRYATKLGIKPFTPALLAQPEVNVRIGAQYFKELMERFGGAHFALASYNAGESRVARWIEQTPGLPTDEFIDNIPYPETQNYVKRILGTADDYRHLYSGATQPAPTRMVAIPTD